MCDFCGVKVEKTLIFYTHTHTHTHVSIAKQKKSPVAILTESLDKAIRMVRFILCHCERSRAIFKRLLRHVVPRNDGEVETFTFGFKSRSVRGSFFLPVFSMFGLCHTYPCVGLPLNRMVFFNYVI